MSSGKGRWDHLLREIPTRKVSSEPSPPSPKPKAAAKAPTKPKPFVPSTRQEPLTQMGQVSFAMPEEPKAAEENIYKVSDINRAIKEQLEGQFSHIWVQGEISNFKAHSSGHFYFSLKDEKSQVNAVMFKGYNSRLKFRPESGMEVVVRGKISVYEPRGNYQVFCEHMEPLGAGALQQAFEQLKAKLKSEGLFDEAIKKPLPDHPKQVAVVTSPTGAAIQDILNVMGRRSRRAQVTVIPARVQGEGAAQEIVRGIELANQVKHFDVLIVGRGGGSIEDLWCFNEEIVARAIAASELPVISAIGHEIDFTISDFVSDRRAPTPSAAAEIVAQSETELHERLRFFSKSLRLLIYQKIRDHKQVVNRLTKTMVNPKKLVEDSIMRLEDYRERLQLSVQKSISTLRLKVQSSQGALKNPKDLLAHQNQRLQSLIKLIHLNIKNRIQQKSQALVSQGQMLDTLSPLRTLDRGYAIVKEGESVIQDINSLKGDSIQVQLRDGTLDAKVTGKHPKEKS